MNTRGARLTATALTLLLLACSPSEPASRPPLVTLPGGFHVGADVSFLQEMEALGQRYLDEAGQPADALVVMRDHGVTTIRLRLWNAPPAGWCNLPHTVAMAKRVRAAGLHLLLDLHYSDRWADPGHQDKPAAWVALHDTALADALFAFTRDTVAALYALDAPPDIVQLGNEITSGLLWPDGRLDGTAEGWERLAALLEAGARGVVTGAGSHAPPKVMIHVDLGGDLEGARAFFRALVDEQVPFDALGLSYYPWWHGGLEALAATLDDLSLRFFRDVYLVETSYPFTDQPATPAGNTVWTPDKLLPGYPPTPEGQRAYLTKVLAIVQAARQGRGKGLFWWSPEWLPRPGQSQPTAGFETLALFDLDGRPLPAQQALRLP